MRRVRREEDEAWASVVTKFDDVLAELKDLIESERETTDQEDRPDHG